MATLRELRVARLLTQEQLGSLAEVSSSTIQNAEAGKATPRPAIVRRIARALGVTPQEIEFPARSAATRRSARDNAGEPAG